MLLFVCIPFHAEKKYNMIITLELKVLSYRGLNIN